MDTFFGGLFISVFFYIFRWKFGTVFFSNVPWPNFNFNPVHLDACGTNILYQYNVDQ